MWSRFKDEYQEEMGTIDEEVEVDEDVEISVDDEEYEPEPEEEEEYKMDRSTPLVRSYKQIRTKEPKGRKAGKVAASMAKSPRVKNAGRPRKTKQVIEEEENDESDVSIDFI